MVGEPETSTSGKRSSTGLFGPSSIELDTPEKRPKSEVGKCLTSSPGLAPPNKAVTESVVAAPKKLPTIRIAEIPDNSIDGFITYIKNLSGIARFSYARAVSTLDNEWCAIISFDTLPSVFQDFNDPPQGFATSVSIPLPTRLLRLPADIHFIGLTPLNHAENPTVDIVAVTGLAGHAFGSWKAQGKYDMWLRDYLPEDIAEQSLQARILIYGYDSKLAESRSHASVHDYAVQFLEALKAARDKEKEKRRPLVLFGHSLGGIVIKHALKEAAQGNEDEKMLFNSCYRLLFFGVPHRGMKNKTLQHMVKKEPNQRLVDDLGVNSQYLEDLQRQFFRHFDLQGSEVLSFYETKDTPTVELNNGYWKRTGPAILMVPRDSAINAARNEVEPVSNKLALDGDHSSMVKFGTRSNQDYQRLRARILEVIKQGPAIVEPRFHQLQNGPTKWLDLLLESEAQQARRTEPRDYFLPGTCEWILQEREFIAMEKDPSTLLLWITGGPGVGKTMISRFLVKHYRKEHTILACFSCDGKRSQNNTPLVLFRDFLYQVFKQSAYLQYRFAKDITTEDTKRFHHWSFLSDSVRKVLEECEEKLFWIIDGLDEFSTDHQTTLIDFINSLSSQNKGNLKAKIILVSRPTLSGLSARPLEVESCLKNNDINLYIKSKIKFLREKKFSSATLEKIRKTLHHNAGKMLLWVNLVVEELQNCVAKDIDVLLSSLPKGLYPYYERILTKLSPQQRSEVFSILGWLYCVARPFSREEFTSARRIKVGIAENREDDLLGDLYFCHPFLVNKEGTPISFTHQSMRDFVREKAEFKARHDDVHSELARICLVCLNDIDGKTSMPLLQYAVDHWSYHLDNSGLGSDSWDGELRKQVHYFFAHPRITKRWLESYWPAHENSTPQPEYMTQLEIASYMGNEKLLATLVPSPATREIRMKQFTLRIKTALQPILRLLRTFQELVLSHANIFAWLKTIQIPDSSSVQYFAAFILYSVHTKLQPNPTAFIRRLRERSKSSEWPSTIRMRRTAILVFSLVWILRVLFRGFFSKSGLISADDVEMLSWTPLHWAARNGHLGAVNLLLSKTPVSINARTHNDRYSSLSLAASKGYTDVVKVLLGRGANSSLRDKRGNTALAWASFYHHTKCVDALRTHARNNSWKIDKQREVATEFCSAAQRGNVEELKSLISRHPTFNINTEGPDGNTAVMKAVSEGNIEAVKFLIDQEAEINLRDTLYDAVRQGRAQQLRTVFDLDEYLHPTSHSHGTNFGIFGLINGDQKLNIDERDSDGRSLLHRATRYDIAKVLIEKGAHVNARDDAGLTPLHLADHEDIVKLLMNNGGKITAADYLKSPLDTDTKDKILEILMKDYEVVIDYPPNSGVGTIFHIGASCAGALTENLFGNRVAWAVYRKIMFIAIWDRAISQHSLPVFVLSTQFDMWILPPALIQVASQPVLDMLNLDLIAAYIVGWSITTA